MTAFALAGRLPLGLISSLGAFTALYGTSMPVRQRLRVLPLVGAGFVAASGLGVLCGGNTWLTVLCLTAVAVAASIVMFGAELGPPGPMQLVLVAGVSARLASPASLAGASIRPVDIPILVGVGAVCACAVVAAPLVVAFGASRAGRTPSQVRGLDAEKMTIAARVSVAVAAAGLLSVLSGARHVYWIVMVAGAVLQATHVSRRSAIRAAQRVIGTLAGVIVFGAIRMANPRGAWLVGVLVLLQFAIEVVVARHYAVALAFITPTALSIASAGGTTSPAELVRERVVDTLLGAGVALLVLWITRRLIKQRDLLPALSCCPECRGTDRSPSPPSR
jgi:hypothetical protein